MLTGWGVEANPQCDAEDGDRKLGSVLQDPLLWQAGSASFVPLYAARNKELTCEA